MGKTVRLACGAGLGLVLSTLLGCSDEASSGVGAGVEFSPPDAPERGTQLHVPRFTLEPGEEIERCMFVNADNAEAGKIVRAEMVARKGIHHAFVVASPTEFPDDEQDCFGIPEELMKAGIPTPLFASSTQVPREEVRFPEGVGLAIEAKQQVVFNFHYLNTTSEPVEGEVFLNLEFADSDEEAELEPAQFFAFGNIDEIAIPPQGSQTMVHTCAFPEDANVISITPHMHAHGRKFKVERHDGTASGETLLETNGWQNPETLVLPEPLALKAGEGLTVSCEWQNTTDKEVGFGPTSEDEMCFAFGFFYPGDHQLIKIDCAVD